MLSGVSAPHLSAKAEGKVVDAKLLRSGLEVWSDQCDIVIIEGVGGLMSPVGETEYIADLAFDFGYPLIVVAPNMLGAINQTLQTLITAANFRQGLEVAGIVLTDTHYSTDDRSVESNREEISARATPPVLARVAYEADSFDADVDWYQLAQLKPMPSDDTR